MFDLHFLRPEYLMGLLVIIPAVIGLWFLGYKLRLAARKAYGEEKLVNRYSKPMRLAGEITLVAAWVAAVTMLVVAAAGPVTKSLPTSVKSGTLQVIAVVDVSKSMAAEDYRSNMPAKDGYAPDMVPGPYGSRLDYVKLILRQQIMPAIIGNQLGVVTYSGNGFEQVPLTDDWSSTKWVMDNWMHVGNAPGGGSDYAEGISMALNMFERDHIAGREQVLLLMTDGGFTGDEKQLAEALEKCRQKGIRLIIVGIGSLTPQPIPQYTASGQLDGYVKKDEQVVLTNVDDAALQKLQAQSGAEYKLLDPNGTGKLDVNWASTLGGTKAVTNEDPVFQYPLGLALVLLSGLFLRGLLTGRKRSV